MQSFSGRIKEIRKGNNVTQKIIAEGIGISERSYIDLENGKYKPNYDNLTKLADYFDVSLDYLVGRSNNPNRN